MFVLNSAIGILFKLPVSIIPIINVVAEFYFNNGLNILIQHLSGLLYTLSLSIQMFIYKRFDKKFQTGFDRLKEKAFNFVKDSFIRCFYS